MRLANSWVDYEVLAAGSGEKLERWGDVILLRPDPQAIWDAPFDLARAEGLAAHYKRSPDGGGAWKSLRPFPPEWNITWRDCTFSVKPMGFKHTGLFPEQAVNWQRMREAVAAAERPVSVLNLFGYTGAASVVLAKAGAAVTHVDAAKNMCERAGQNARLSGADGIRYIVDDCMKFVAREIRRGKTYDAVLLDPPSYGRGPGGEMWRLEDSIFSFMKECKKLLSDTPLFVLLNSYTTGLSPSVTGNILSLVFGAGGVDADEIGLPISASGIVLPCGCSAYKNLF